MTEEIADVVFSTFKSSPRNKLKSMYLKSLWKQLWQIVQSSDSKVRSVKAVSRRTMVYNAEANKSEGHLIKLKYWLGAHPADAHVTSRVYGRRTTTSFFRAAYSLISSNANSSKTRVPDRDLALD